MGYDDDESMTSMFDNDICLTNLTLNAYAYKAINALKIDRLLPACRIDTFINMHPDGYIYQVYNAIYSFRTELPKIMLQLIITGEMRESYACVRFVT